MPKLTKLLFSSLCLAFILIPLSTKASAIKSGENVYLSQNETIEGNLYAASNNITIDGEIKGDLIAVAQVITINGRLDGDLIATAQTIIVNGEVNGSVRLLANTANLNGQIARNVNFAGNSLNVGENAKINWDLLSAAINTNIRGLIQGNVYGSGDNFILSGTVAKDFNFSKHQGKNITLSQEAIIGGDLNYNQDTELILKTGANISGNINLTEKENNKKTNNYLWSLLYSIFATILIGLVLISLGKKLIPLLREAGEDKAALSLGLGLLTFLISPVIITLLMITVVGIPLALILLIALIILFFLGKVFTTIFIGREFIRLVYHKKRKTLITPLIAGVIITCLLFSLPYIGWILSLLAASFGFGALILYVKNNY